MTTFTFNELDERGQQTAVALYCYEPQVVGMGTIPEQALHWLPWRFTEHGERIA